MRGKQGEVIWPRLVANKILKKTIGSNNFVADFPTNSSSSSDALLEFPILHQPSSYNSHNSFNNPPSHPTYTYKVFVSTWNVGGIAPHDQLHIEDWLDTSCDIYVLGFQEIVPLRAANVLGYENSKISMKWNSFIREALSKKTCMSHEGKDGKQKARQDFKCIISKQMVGILISVWVRSDLHSYIRHPNVSCVGCGIMGCLGNKGSVSVRFQLHKTSFCFVCSHLASGGKDGDEKYRNANVTDILSRTGFPTSPSIHLPKKILDHDRVILLGDLNYRVSLPEATTRLLVDKKEWDTLLENDQLRMELMKGQVFDGWNEGMIDFPPTYKYYLDSDVYYGSEHGRKGEKRRAPAWCDRIIWYGKGLKQVSYSRGESKLSDHRPVKAIFTAQVESLETLKGLQGFFLSNRFERFSNYQLQQSLEDEFLGKDKSISEFTYSLIDL